MGLAVAVCALLLATTASAPIGAGSVGSPGSGPAAQSAPGAPAPIALYMVTLIESGLAVDGAYSVVWGIAITGGLSYSSTLGIISVYLANGTYQYTTHSSDNTRSAPPGTFTVRGGPASVYVAYVSVTSVITFTEEGLPNGTNWTLSVDGSQASSTTDSIVFVESNGSSSFAVTEVPDYQASPTAGSVMVGGSPITQAIVFSRITPGIYRLTFVGSALPSNATWSIVLNGATENVVGSTLGLSEPNGSYSFTVLPPLGYAASPTSGTAVINGSAVPVPIDFSQNSAGSSSGISGFDYFWGAFIVIAIAIAVFAVLWVWTKSRGPPRGF
ncbi:MAG TPA: hypothetical protein VMV28_06100 [Thermoplasmata archaeon]|nr:hypothetical protein [Thermoplasmata archaeon]